MSAGPHPRSERIPSQHIGTIAHEGLLWDAYLEFDDDPKQPHSFRGRVCFTQAGGDGAAAAAETTVIIIEESYEEAVAKARSFDERGLQGLLRSAL
jgi:hypothetical protein